MRNDNVFFSLSSWPTYNFYIVRIDQKIAQNISKNNNCEFATNLGFDQSNRLG
jgi:hypothetical protein